MKYKIAISRFIPLFVIMVLLSSTKLSSTELNKQPETITKLHQEIDKILNDYNIPGATVALVSKDDLIWIQGFGKSDVAVGKDADTNTIFRWGSISKSFVSVAVMMLVEQGMLSLDDKIKDIAPEIEFKNRWESTNPVRIVHCLEHTTGFDDLHYKELAYDDPEITLAEGLAINPKSRNSRWIPGTYMSYCNVGPAIAAYIVEKVSEMSFEEFVQKKIFDPLGMNTASFYYPEEMDLISKGYKEDGKTEVKYDHIFARCAASLNASSQDMAHFVMMMLNQGTFENKDLLKPESIKRIQTPTSTLAAQEGFPFGYGLGNYTIGQNGFVYHGHEGGIAGFVAIYGYNTELDRGFAISINKVSDEGLVQIIETVTNFIINDIPKIEPSAAKFSVEKLQSYTGYYQQLTPMTQLQHYLYLGFFDIRHIILEDGKLFSGNFLTKRKKELIPLSNNVFRRKSQMQSHMIFFQDDHDQIIGYDGFRGNFKKTSGFWVFFRFCYMLFSLFIMITSLIFALIWIPRKLFSRIKKVKYFRARVFSLLAVLFFFATYILLFIGSVGMDMDKEMMMKLGSFTLFSFAIFFFSICFALFAILGLYYSLRAFGVRMNKVARIHTLLVSIVNIIVVIYFLSAGIIGLMTWAY